MKELQSSQDKLRSKINNLHFADKDYFITASYLLDLSNRAHELFESSEMEEKRQLIKLVFQNLELDGRTVRYKYAKPFDQIFKYADRQAWLPLIDMFINKEVQIDIELFEVKNIMSALNIQSDRFLTF